MRSLAVVAAGAVSCALLAAGFQPAGADVLVNVSKTSQRMAVMVDGTARYNWKVSTGGKGYGTPSGVYKPQWLARKWKSRQYNNAPMPHSIFFYKGYAIHGTTEVARLGRIASHGCVRLAPENAAKLFAIVQNQMANTRIVVSNDTIDVPGEAPKRAPTQIVADKMEPPAKLANKPAAKFMAKPVTEPVARPLANTLPEKVVAVPAVAVPKMPAAVAVEAKAERGPEPKAELKPEPRAEPKMEPRAEPKAETRTGIRPETKPETRTEMRETPRQRAPRKERVARSDSRPGFHW